MLFVCTKRQLKDVVREEAERCGQFYVTERWLGGMLTNFRTIKKNLKRLKEIERMREDGTFELLHEEGSISDRARVRQAPASTWAASRTWTRCRALVFVVDAKKERIAVAEANKLGIPLIAIVDTNADPDLITVPIAGNDDAIKAVRLITSQIAEATIEARDRLVREEQEERAIAEQAEIEAAAAEGRPVRPAARGAKPRRKIRAPRLAVDAEEAETETETEEEVGTGA